MLVRETGLAHRRRKHKQADNQDEKDGEAEGRDTRDTATSSGGGVIAAAAAAMPPLPPPSHGLCSIPARSARAGARCASAGAPTRHRMHITNSTAKTRTAEVETGAARMRARTNRTRSWSRTRRV